MYYTKYKKEKFGICNVCLKEADLSWDHVPPKGGLELSAVEMQSILQRVSKNNDKFVISQNGVKYRTICKKCNEFFGKTYDKPFNDFVKSISLYLNSKLILPKTIYFKTQPNFLVKAILAHLLSAKVDIDEVEFDEKIRGFILDENSTIPDDIHIFYWIYPYHKTIIIRDSIMPTVRGKFNNFSLFQILKYFPIAYLITDANSYENLPELTKYCFDDNLKQIEIPINLERIEGDNWPEIVDNSNIFSGGKSWESSIIAKPRIKKQ